MAAFPTTVATDSDLYIAVNAVSTQLTDNPLSNSATTVNVTSTASFPTVGFISIDNEIISYTGKTGTSFTGCGRGADGTSATSHVQNSQVFHNVIAIHHNALKNDLIATEQFISDVIGRTNTQIQVPTGSASVPSISFAGATNTGLYRGGNDINITTAGSIKWSFANSTGFLRSQGTWGIQAGDGSVTLPAFSFVSDDDTGIYRGGTNDLRFACGGTAILQLDASFLYPLKQTQSIDGTVGAPTYSFFSDPDTGIYRSAANTLAFSAGGIQALRMDAGNMYITRDVLLEADNTYQLGASTFGWSKLFMGSGTVSLPSIAFSNDTDTGIYRPAANQVALSSGGAVAILCDPTAVNFYVGGALRWQMDGDLTSTGDRHVRGGDGTAGAPTFSFASDIDTGMYSNGANEIAWSSGGTKRLTLTTAPAFQPGSDNAVSLGSASFRWTTVFAANGTINTSHSSTKTNILDLDPKTIEVPRGVSFDRDGRRYIGYLNDTLPIEARPTEDGKIVETMNFEASVVGVLCAAVRQLQAKVAELESK